LRKKNARIDGPKARSEKKVKFPLFNFPKFVNFLTKVKTTFCKKVRAPAFLTLSLSLDVSVSANRLFCFSYKGIFV